jgi:hypothetical protein
MAVRYRTEIVALKYFTVYWTSACWPWDTNCCGYSTSFSVCVTEKHCHFAQPTCNNFSVYYALKDLNNSTSSGWSLHIAWPGSSIITTPLSHANCGASVLLVWVEWPSKRRRIFAGSVGVTVATKFVSDSRNNPLFMQLLSGLNTQTVPCVVQSNLSPAHALLYVIYQHLHSRQLLCSYLSPHLKLQIWDFPLHDMTPLGIFWTTVSQFLSCKFLYHQGYYLQHFFQGNGRINLPCWNQLS